MASPAAILTIVADAQTADAQAQLERLERTTRSTATTTASSARAYDTHTKALGRSTKETSTMSKATSTLGGALKTAALAAGSAAIAYVSIAQAKEAVSTTEDLAKSTLTLHRNLGLSVKTASEWASVAKVRGVATTQLGMAFKTLATQVEAAKGGSATAKDMFKQLGISMGDLKKSNANETIKQVSDGINKLGAGTERTAIASKLFGRGWQTIVPVLRDGSKELQAQLDLANKYGATFGGKSIQSVKDLIAAERELQFAQLGLQIAFTEKVAPALLDAALAIAQFINQMRKGKGAGADFVHVAGTIVNAIGDVIAALSEIYRRFRFVFKTIGIILMGFKKIVVDVFQVISNVLQLRFGKALQAAWHNFRDFATTLGQATWALLTPFHGVINKIKDVFVGGIKSAMKAVVKAVEDAGAIIGVVGKAMGAVFMGVAKVVSKVATFIVKVVSAVVKALGGIHDALPDISLPGLPSLGGGPLSGITPGKKQGGLAAMVPGAAAGDRHMLTLNGQPIARVESGEGIFVGNRNMMAVAAKMNAQVPRRAGGGPVAGTAGMKPAAQALASFFVNKFGGGISSGLRAGDTGSFHSLGEAFDWVPGNANAATAYANKIGPQLLEGIHNPAGWGRSVSWDSGHQVSPGFWGASTWADHIDHLHIAVAQAIKGAVGGAMKAAAARIPNITIKGHGPLADATRGGVNKMRHAGNAFLAKLAPKTATSTQAPIKAGSVQQLAHKMILAQWGASQWPPFVSLEMGEAGWNVHAQNPTSSAYGLAQNINPSTYPPAGRPGSSAPLLTQAQAQLSWMINYIQGRYGNPAGAWAAWQARSPHWYGSGADFYTRGPEVIGVGERGREHVQVTPASQTRRYAITITNWKDGTGYMREIAGDEVDGQRRLGNQLSRMRRD